MELANKNHFPNDSTSALIQASAFYEHNFGMPSLVHSSPSSSPEIYAANDEQPRRVHHHQPDTAEMGSGLAKNFVISNSSAVSSPSSTNSNGLGLQQAKAYNLSEEGHSVISFKPDYSNLVHGNGSFLSFEQPKNEVPRNLYTRTIGKEDEYPIWGDDWSPNYSYLNSIHKCVSAGHGLPETSSSQHAAAGQFSSWLNDQEENTIADGFQELGREEESKNKRPSTGECVQASKKQCGVASKRPKSSKSLSTAKDPQSIAAKNRRERISERLKTLQDLVPNGSKVDLVTMLEKAISYVKFLQLQVKVLATDEFWPTNGGKAPELSQVKEAIDAILSSQRDRNSNSNSK